jgi:PAS domain S-box-containing protein
VLDADLRVRRFTPMAGTLLNLIAGDVGRPFSNIASTLEVTDWKEVFQEVTQGGLVEREVSDRNGHRYSMRVRPYKTDDNRIEGVLVVMLDTDLIYRARDDARKAGDYAQAIVETIHEALAVVDSACEVSSVNHTFCNLFQVTPQEMQGKSFFGTGPGQAVAPELRGLLRDVLSDKTEIKDFEIDQAFPRIGRRRLVLNASRIASTQTILIAIEDATVRKQAQEESERSESTIRALLDSSLQSVITVNADGKIATVNGHSEKMFGYSQKELIGQPADILIPEFARDRQHGPFATYMAKTESRPRGIGLSFEGRRRDGSTFPVDIALSGIETTTGKLTVVFVTDITQRRQLEKAEQTHAAQVQALAARLLSAQEEERRRVSRELHDQICQQLAALAIDISAFAASPTPPPGDRERVLKELQARVVKASEATRHIAYQLHPSVLDDLGLVTSLRALCKQFSDREGVAVQFHHSELPSAIAREVASCLYRVAQESLQNIATHSGAKKVSVTISQKKGGVVLSIVDDGTGFDPDLAAGSGGLGLVGMEERARLVNGNLTIAAQPGRGTKVTLKVPMAEAIL